MRGSRKAVARAAERPTVPAWLVGVTAGVIGLLAAGASFGQVPLGNAPNTQGSGGAAPAVPEVVRPQNPSLTVPPTGGAQTGGTQTAPVPGSTPLVGGDGPKPIPDTGVIQPPVTNPGSPAVVAPPSTAGTMPVIPPPGTAGRPGPVPK